MSQTVHNGGVAIFGSIFLALSLSVIPMPESLDAWRPEWVTMTIIYWCMAVPTRFAVFLSWTTGLMLDALRSGLLGQQALALALIAYIVHRLHRRLRAFPMWQQSVIVMFLVALQAFLQLWINGFSGRVETAAHYLLPILSSTLIWPAIFVSLRYLRRSFRIH